MAEKEKPEHGCVLAVRLRGTVADAPDVRKTMDSLSLDHVFKARLLKGDASNVGMLRRVKELVAWGVPSPVIVEGLLRKRGERDGLGRGVDDSFAMERFGVGLEELAKRVVSGEVELSKLWRAGLRPRFRLHPPKGGFKRSTRRAFSDGGELGDRGDEINSLVKRMI